jgi:hypothetical protein
MMEGEECAAGVTLARSKALYAAQAGTTMRASAALTQPDCGAKSTSRIPTGPSS